MIVRRNETQVSVAASRLPERAQTSAMSSEKGEVCSSLMQRRKVSLLSMILVIAATLASTVLISYGDTNANDGFLIRQRRHLRTMVRSWSASSSKAFSCQDLLESKSLQEAQEPVRPLPYSRRSLQDESHKVYNPLLWNDTEKLHAYTENPTLQRVDRILQEAMIYNKDLVIDVTGDDTLAMVSLYASAYGWPVLTLQTNSKGQVQEMCEATSSASHHHVLPLWASNFNSVPSLEEGDASDEVTPTVRLDQLAALTTSSTSSRIRLLHIQLPQGEWKALQGASKLLSQGRIDHVLISLHFTEQLQETEAVRVLDTLFQSGYGPMDDKDRKQLRDKNHPWDATEYLRHLIQLHRGTTREVWFYRNQT